MKPYILLLIISAFSFSSHPIYPWSEKLNTKIQVSIGKQFPEKQFEIKELTFDATVEEATPSLLNQRLFELNVTDEGTFYLYVGEAPSMKNIFDFMLIFDDEYSILKSKILIYREQHGRQIGASRWLNQFKGLGSEDRPELGVEIDGISGATISANNMTIAVKDVLSSLAYLNTLTSNE